MRARRGMATGRFKGHIIGFAAIARYALRKILLSRRVILAVLIAVLLAAVLGYAAQQEVERLAFGTDLLDALILSFFLPIIAMIYGASIIRNEIEDRSITQIVVSPLDRIVAYLAYYVALLAALVVIMALLVTVGFVAFFAQLGIDADAVRIYGSMLALSVIGAAVYAALFLFLSVLLKRPLYFGLFYAFVWEGFIGSIPGPIHTVAVKHYVRSIASEWMPFGNLAGYDATALGGASAVLVGSIAAFLVVGAIVFATKEFP